MKICLLVTLDQLMGHIALWQAWMVGMAAFKAIRRRCKCYDNATIVSLTLPVRGVELHSGHLISEQLKMNSPLK